MTCRDWRSVHTALLARLRAGALLGLASLATASAAGQEPQHQTVGEALRNGSVSVDLRYRYEHVSDKGFALDADASTLRTALAYQTKPYEGFALFLEAENVSLVGRELYHNVGVGNLNNRRSDRPVVADPGLTQMNQAGLRYSMGETTVSAGRQEILLDDQRFVGNVGWRQNHQSFDAIRVESSDLPSTTVNYAFIGGVHGIRGGGVPVAGHVLNAAFAPRPTTQVVGYAYAVDYERDPTRSTVTLGVELSGSSERGAGRVLYELEFADQRAAAANPLWIDTAYLHVMGGGGVGGVALKVGWERLGGSSVAGQFNTPLATLHPFNGWVDRCLVTPEAGLEDVYEGVRGTAGNVQWSATYHEFRSDTGAVRYGDEIDAEVQFLAPWRQTIAVKAAFYEADAHATDVAKVMVWSAFRF